VLQDHHARRVGDFEAIVFDQPDAETTYRTVGRSLADFDFREPRWSPLLAEFLAHAARNAGLRKATVDLRERFLERLAQIIEALARQHGVRFRLPALEIARGSGALGRGMSLERQLTPETGDPALFEEMFAAYLRGLAL
jgi:hypothetical protein